MVKFKSFWKTKRILIRVYDERKLFPVSGRGWVVEKVVMPTMKRGSQSTILKRFKSAADAERYYKKIKSMGVMKK